MQNQEKLCLCNIWDFVRIVIGIIAIGETQSSVSVCDFRKLFARILLAKTISIAIKRSLQTESLKAKESILLKTALCRFLRY